MIVLGILVEGLRPDRMGCYGHTRSTTPQLDRLAERGAIFTRAYASDTPGTRGLINVLSGRRAGGCSETPSWMQDFLASKGYKTVAVAPRKVGPFLGPGWDEIHEIPRSRKVWSTDPKQVTKKALDRLLKEEDIFLLCCLEIPVHPKAEIPLPFFTKYWPKEDSDKGNCIARDWAWYDASVRSMDLALKPLLDAALQEKDRFVFCCSTCGMMLGEKKVRFAPVGIYEGTQKAAFLLSFPKRNSAPLAVGSPVSLMDLFPTFLEWLGESSPKVIQGKSLIPLLRGKARETRNVLHLGHSDQTIQTGIVSNQFKLVRTFRRGCFDIPPLSMYDLTADPGEEKEIPIERTRFMDDQLIRRYKAPPQKLPENMLSWRLYGAGMENLGKQGKPETVPLPPCGPRELIMRVDAVGLCFSDTKVVKAGPDHPRLLGRDLKKDPTVLGHEVAGTVVLVGKKIQDRFHAGERYLVQADVYYQGVTMAYGYVFRGGLRQYTLIPQQMVDGDEGTYLLPLGEDSGYSQGALVEPWACVIAAFDIPYRKNAKEEGHLCIAADKEAKAPDLEGLYADGAPCKVSLVGPARSFLSPVKNRWSACEIAEMDDLPTDKIDDLLLVGRCSEELVSNAFSLLAVDGVLCQVGSLDQPLPVSVDIGRIHYDHLGVLGTETNKPADAYQKSIRSAMTSAGKAWFLGAGGPMGRMHIQHALQMNGGPAVVVASEVSQERLDDLMESFLPLTEGKDKQLIGLNPAELGPEGFADRLREIAPEGFDDIIVLAPLPRLIEEALPFAAKDAVLNAFAGLSRGTRIHADLCLFAGREGLRAIGSSGSRIKDMATMLHQTESGEVDTDRSVAAISGIYGVHEGLQAVIDNVYPGKVVVYPQIADLGVVSLDHLHEIAPTVASRLRDGRWWCKEAEEELLKQFALPRIES